MSQESTSIRQLVSDVAKDAKHLLDVQGELAKVEMKDARDQASTTGGLFAVAAGAGAMGGIFLLVTIAWVLVELGLPVWAGFGIVTLTLFIVAGATGLVGKKKAGALKPMVVTKREIERTKKVLAGATQSTDVAVRPDTLPKQRA